MHLDASPRSPSFVPSRVHRVGSKHKEEGECRRAESKGYLHMDANIQGPMVGKGQGKRSAIHLGGKAQCKSRKR